MGVDRLERLELEYHQDCNFDGVHLYDGSLAQDSKKLASFCGNLTDDLHRINSISDSMTVTFITDYSIQLAGFAAAIDFTLGKEPFFVHFFHHGIEKLFFSSILTK